MGAVTTRKITIAALTASASLAALAPQPAFSQAAGGQSAAAQVENLSLPSQSLSQSVLAIGRQFNMVVIAPDPLVRGKTAPAISGVYTASEALDRALAGSGLDWRRSPTGEIVIAQREAARNRTSNDRPPVVMDSIIVTGTKQNLSVQETTNSVEIFDSERLENEALFTLNEALSRSPNTSIIGDSIAGINIRGINRNGTNGAGQGEAINVFIDGVPVSGDGLAGVTTIWDTEQVEVLRGSQSTVKGRNAIAGAVVVESKKPGYEWKGAARVRIADFGTRQYAGAISGPIVEDQLAFRLSADYQETDGFITDGFSGEDDNFQENLTIRGRALIEPDAIDGLSALFTVEYSDRNFGLSQPTVRAPSLSLLVGADDVAVDPDLFENFDPQNRVSFDPFERETDLETIKAIGDIAYDFTDAISLKFIGTYEDTESFSSGAERRTNQFADLGNFTDGDTKIYTAEARLHFDFDKLSGLVGGYYFKSEVSSVPSRALALGVGTPFVLTPADSVVVIEQTIESDVENYAFFTSWRYEPNEKWDLDFGFRFDREEFIIAREVGSLRAIPGDCSALVPGFFVGSPEPIVTAPCADPLQFLIPPADPLQDNNFGVALPSGAVTYNINSDVSVFAGVRRGYRAGGTFLSLGGDIEAGDDLFQIVVFDPEFLVSYEAGWRSQWLDGKLTLNGTAFFSDYKNQQVSFTDERGFNITANAGDTVLYGLELSADYQATPNWNIYGSLGLLETDVREFILQEDDPDTPEDETIDLAGNDLEQSPAVSFTLGTSYRHDSGLFGSISLNYRSSAESEILNLGPEELLNGLTERVEPAALMNARVGYEIGNFRLTAFATNLLNENDPENIRLGTSDTVITPGVLAPFPQFVARQPRTFGISLDAAF